MAKRNRASTGITAASEMPPYPTPGKSGFGRGGSPSRPLRTAGKAEQSSHRDNGGLGDAALATPGKSEFGRGGSPSRPPRTAGKAEQSSHRDNGGLGDAALPNPPAKANSVGADLRAAH